MGVNGFLNKLDFWAKSTPQHVAIRCGGLLVCYSTLQNLVYCLRDKIGRETEKEARAVLLMGRCPEITVSVLACIAAGRIFVPIDPAYPSDRISYMAAQAAPDIIVTIPEHAEYAREIIKKQGINAKIAVLEIFSGNECVPEIKANGERLFRDADTENKYSEKCYIYFTSGSTGKPKGILGKYSSLYHFIEWEAKEFGLDHSACVSQLISPSFDPFLRDLLVPFFVGGTLCIPDCFDRVIEPGALADWMAENRITLAHMGKTLFISMCEELTGNEDLDALRYILLSGESLKGSDLKKFYLFYKNIKIVNLYGPTETTLAASFYVAGKDDNTRVNVPIGKGIDDVSLLVTHDDLSPCNEGEDGEILIVTDFASFGYWLNPEETAKSFILYNGKPAYKTGDIGRVLSGGNIECLGRRDRQVKLNGIRIELSEIETVLQEILNTAKVCVAVQNLNGGRSRLAAYYVSKTEIDAPRLSSMLHKKLPAYMIPSFFMRLNAFPMLPNGKVDYKSLPDMPKADNIIYGGKAQETVARIIGRVLGVRVVSPEDNILQLGANSLDAAKIAAEVQKEFNTGLSAGDVLSSATAESIASLIDTKVKSYSVPINPGATGDVFAMTEMQKSMYLLYLMRPADISYNVTTAVEVMGEINTDQLQTAIDSLVRSDAVLRTVYYIDEGGKFWGRVLDNNVSVALHRIDYACEYKQIPAVDNLLPQLSNKCVSSFDLAKLPLFRVFLITLEDNHYLLIKDTHHIITDEISESIFWERLFRYLSGCYTENPVRLDYQDFAGWYGRQVESGAYYSEREYWQKELTGYSGGLDLPTDHKICGQRGYAGEHIAIDITAEMAARLKVLAEENGITKGVVFLAAFVLLLHRYSAQSDFCIGVPMEGRGYPGTRDIMGLFVNTLPVRMQINVGQRKADFLRYVFDRLVGAIKNSHYPFGRIVDDLKIKPEQNKNPLYNCMFNYIIDKSHFHCAGLEITKLPPLCNSSKLDLSLIVYDTDDGPNATIQYASELFARGRIVRMVKHYANILESLLTQDNAPISDTSMLDGDELDYLLLQDGNCAVKETVVRLIIRAAASHPDKIAVVADTNVNYRQFDDMSNFIANMVLAKNPPGNTLVGVVLHRYSLLLPAIVGILKAGFSYLPIDPDYPEQRVEAMLKEGGCSLLLTDFAYASDRITIRLNLQTILEQSVNAKAVDKSSVEGDAYVIYTSGSTGKPKGVVISHSGLASFTDAVRKEIVISSDTRILCVTTICFDIFVLEFLVPLVAGATVILADEYAQKDPHALAALIAEHQIDTIQFTPSRLRLCLETWRDIAPFQSLRQIIVGGEAFDEAILNLIPPSESLCIFNVYGPTEATVWCMVKKISGAGATVTIGRRFCNTELYVLNERLQLQPVGLPGELYIGGACLSRGYLNRPDLTAERFIKNPYKPGGLMYKTGDFVELLDNGELNYLGRADFQIKLRGFRIELSEIEGTMVLADGVSKCVCNVHAGDNGYDMLVAYYTGDTDVDVGKMREFLSRSLPNYMIPEAFVRLPSFPMTLNGKVDRGKLPSPELLKTAAGRWQEENLDEVEASIREIWQEVLRREDISIYDNFIDLGGNSTSLVRMHGKLEDQYPGRVSIAQLFEYPKIVDLARFLSGARADKRELDGVLLTGEFYGGGVDGILCISFTLDESVVSALMRWCADEQLCADKLLLSLYIYVMAELSGQAKVTVYLADKPESGKYFEVAADMENYDDLQQMIADIGDAFAPICITRDTVATAINRDCAVVAFTYNQPFDENCMEHFDIAVSVTCTDELLLSCYYSGRRLSTNGVERLFNIYLSIIEKFIIQYKTKRNE